MGIHVYDYLNVQERAVLLGCNPPTEIAILPKNFATAPFKRALTYQESTSIIRALWQQEGIIETSIEKSRGEIPEAQEKTFEWIGPIIFFGLSVISQNQYLISLALGVISNYLTDVFKGLPKNRTLTLDIIVEKTKGKQYKRIHFEGSLQDLEEAKLDELILHISKEK